MVEHIVLFKFKPETTKEQKEEAMRRLRALKSVLPGINDIQTNHNFTDRGKGYVMGLTVRFDSMEAFEHYGPSPEHQAVLSYLKEIGLEDTLAVDFTIE
ncbi:Dabb family protein [Camelliibacillus cellulosilyticus]|uniref:Dabb family protein n=1 Tax=Camelliibacillus cellulosilyticus TaxID=2174486 RepID=A0ABV9GMW2_9BACL